MKRYLTEQEQVRLLAAAKALADPLAQRDYHWMACLILTGMRITEWRCLTVSRVVQGLAAGWLVSDKVHCKGKRGNEYLVTARLRYHLGVLVGLSHALGEGLPVPLAGQPLVWGRAGLGDGDGGSEGRGVAGPLSVRSYEARLKHWAGVASLDLRISPHWLRHTRAMNIMRRSSSHNPLKVTQLALGHASVSSTGVYLQMSREELERELHLVDGGRVPKRLARAVVEGVAA